MYELLFDELLMNETDVEGAIARLSGDEALYVSFLKAFLNDNTMSDLGEAIDTLSWDAAFTAAHALKGVAANLGFAPLYHSLGELVISIRAGRLKEINAQFEKARAYYSDLICVIKEHCLGTN